MTPKRESLETDIVIVGGGPAGLSTAIRLKQLDPTLDITLLDKAAEIGNHLLSGAILEPRALNELIPDWQQRQPPTHTPVSKDQFLYLTSKHSWRLPTPTPMKNYGNYIISLAQFSRWLAEQAQSLGVNIFPSFAATGVLTDNENRVIGILTGDKGADKNNQPKSNFQAGIEIHAKFTILAEGCRGSLTEKVIKHYQLRSKDKPQSYALGIKEVWRIPKQQHQAGHVMHSIGWPLDKTSYGGSFLYHFDKDLISLGMVVGLDYQNPYLNPFEELQRFKTHPAIKPLLENGERIAYGARSLNEGGWQAIPELIFPGGAIVGCAAGFLNVPKLKGIHTAMKSGMLAAESIHQALQKNIGHLNEYPVAIKQSWIHQELYRARNIRPAFRYGLFLGLSYAAIDTYLLRGHAPWTFKYKPDHSKLKTTQQFQPIDYPKADNKITFDKVSSLYLCTIDHPDDQPCHLKLRNPDTAIQTNYQQYASPETAYCPANVYEIITNADTKQARLQINAQNCIHCKACDIKDPTQNIQWHPPEGGSGPNYSTM